MTTQQIDWADYRQLTEKVPPEDGGGYRVYFPTLGYAVYGVGDTLEEAVAPLERGKTAFQAFAAKNGVDVPRPTSKDLAQREALAECNTSYAYGGLKWQVRNSPS